MMFILLSPKINLKVSPIFAVESSQQRTQMTLGDLHANAIKFVHTLVRYGVCDIESSAFKTLLGAYKKRDDQAFLDCIKKHLKVRNNKILVRLIGDIVADRGKNDLYVLAILDKLRSNRVPVTTLISNHDAELILAYEAYQKNGKILDRRREIGIPDPQKSSFIAFSKSIALGHVVSKPNFERLMDEIYLPTLKLIDYSLSETDSTHITVFTHAPTDLDGICRIAGKFNIQYQADTVRALAHTIDQINTACMVKVQSGTFTDVYDESIEDAVWNREEDLSAGSEMIPAEKISFVYGHTEGGEHARTNVFKIDNLLGKVSNLTYGSDPVFVSDEAYHYLPNIVPNKATVEAISDALLVLKNYSAGTAVAELIQSIQYDMKHYFFKQAKQKLAGLNDQCFEGQGGENLDAETRWLLEKAWYNVITGIRFFLSLLTAIFTKKSDHKNPLAERVIGRPFFFQKPRTRGENALIEEKMSLLESAKAVLVHAMDVPQLGPSTA